MTIHSATIDSERVDLMGVKKMAEDPPPEPGNQAGERAAETEFHRSPPSRGHKAFLPSGGFAKHRSNRESLRQKGALKAGRRKAKNTNTPRKITERATSLEFMCLRSCQRKGGTTKTDSVIQPAAKKAAREKRAQTTQPCLTMRGVPVKRLSSPLASEIHLRSGNEVSAISPARAGQSHQAARRSEPCARAAGVCRRGVHP
jgi:hypothetical protein